MKKVLLAAMLLCLFIACTKEQPPAKAKQTTLADDPVDQKIYDTIPILIPQDSSTFINRNK